MLEDINFQALHSLAAFFGGEKGDDPLPEARGSSNRSDFDLEANGGQSREDKRVETKGLVGLTSWASKICLDDPESDNYENA